jgi:hypothetical protein
MPPKNPQPSYTKKPVRRLRLPKMGPPKTKSFFEEYFYACVAMLFLVVTVLCWAGGMSGLDALVVGGWVAGSVWCGKMLKGYLKEKEKTKPAAAPPKAGEPANGKVVLPPGMKPMIGPQWPVKSGVWPTRPGLRTFPSIPKSEDRAPTAPESGSSGPAPPVSAAPASDAPGNANKPNFRYERPTLPERKTKLPHNWLTREPKKPRR